MRRLYRQQKILRIKIFIHEEYKSSANSFAGKLHGYLARVKGIRAAVIARNTIVVINEQTPFKGIRTDKPSSYFRRDDAFKALNEAEDRANKTKSPKDIEALKHAQQKFNDLVIEFERRNSHQLCLTKSAFLWDPLGRQVKIDGYVESFFRKIQSIRKDLFEMLKNNMDAAAGKAIALELERIQTEFDPWNFSYKTIERLRESINLIGLEMKKMEIAPQQKHSLMKKIDEILTFSKRSIEKSSCGLINYGVKIDDPPSKEMENIREIVSLDFINPPNNELRNIPPGKAKVLKKLTSNLLRKFVSNQVYSNLCRNKPVENERLIANFIVSVLQSVNKLAVPVVDRCEEIADLERRFSEISRAFPKEYEECLAYLEVFAGEAKAYIKHPD